MRALVLALALLVAAAGGVAARADASVPSGLSDDPLDRGTLLALPSVYRLEVTIRVDALRLRDGRVLRLPPQARDIPEVGAAVAVAPGGWLVTAAHVAAPAPETVARLAYQTLQAYRGRSHGDAASAREWVARTGAVAVPGRVTSTVVTPARVAAGGVPVRERRGLETRASATADLALVRIHAPGAPALRLVEATSRGTPVATIGFSGDERLLADGVQPGDPTVRRGAIRTTATLEPDSPEARRALVISAGVRSGDSGGPVVDADGAVRGIVIQRGDSGGGVAESATEVRTLLRDEGIDPGEGEAAEAFRAGMADLWRLDLEGAEAGLTRTLRAFPDHRLASRELERTRELAGGGFALRGRDRRDGLLLAIAIVALVGAAACALGLAWPSLTRARRGPRGGLG